MRTLTLFLLAMLFSVVGCTPGTPVPTVALADTSWVLTGYGDPAAWTTPIPGIQVTLVFEEEQAGGHGSCNYYGGGYTLDGDRLSFDEIASTAMDCPGDVIMAQEAAYLELLWQNDSFQVTQTVDSLTLTGDMGALQFVRLQPASLTGKRWQLRGIAVEPEAVISTWVDETITLIFDAGTVSGSAGCNALTGAYELEADGNGIQFGALTVTDQACDSERNQREAEFLAALAAVAQFELDHQSLTLQNDAGETLLTFQLLPDPLPAALVNAVWRVVALETPGGPLPAQTETPITVQFYNDHLWGDGGCNAYAAPFFITPEAYLLFIGDVGRSARSCDSASMQVEAAFFELLADVQTFTLENETLRLLTEDGAISLTPMGFTEYMPRFVALADGRICQRTTPDDTTRIDGRSRSYFCDPARGELLVILGPLQPTDAGWQAALVELTRSGDAIVTESTVTVTLP